MKVTPEHHRLTLHPLLQLYYRRVATTISSSSFLQRPPPPPTAVSNLHTYSIIENQNEQKQTGSDAYEESERHAVALDADLDRVTRLCEATDISEASHLFIYT